MMFRKKEKDSDQKSWFALILLSVLFYGSILVLTFIAEDVRNSRLPKVTAQRLGTQKFTYEVTISNGTETRTTTALAIPKHLVDSDQVYSLLILYNSETEETHCYVQKVSLTIDKSKENPDYYAVMDSNYLLFVTEGYEGLEDSDEVYYEGAYKK